VTYCSEVVAVDCTTRQDGLVGQFKFSYRQVIWQSIKVVISATAYCQSVKTPYHLMKIFNSNVINDTQILSTIRETFNSIAIYCSWYATDCQG